MNTELLDNPAERRKQVRLSVRPDLHISEQRYEGKVYHVVKDPVCLRYYRFNKQEYFVFSLFDGKHTMEEVRKRFEDEFKPHRLESHDLESFARQLVTAGLVQHEALGTGKHLFQRRAKQRRLRRFAAITNILYWKIPLFDPDRIHGGTLPLPDEAPHVRVRRAVDVDGERRQRVLARGEEAVLLDARVRLVAVATAVWPARRGLRGRSRGDQGHRGGR